MLWVPGMEIKGRNGEGLKIGTGKENGKVKSWETGKIKSGKRGTGSVKREERLSVANAGGDGKA